MRWCALLLVLLAGCQPASRPPSGSWLTGDAQTLRSLLPRLERLTNTPAAAAAHRAAAVLTTCTTTAFGAGDGLVDALAQLQCGAPPDEVARWADVGAGGLGIIRPVGAMGTLHGVLRATSTGELHGRLVLFDSHETGFSRVFIPANDAPKELVLTTADALIHFRMKARDGIDISSLSSGQGADLFGLNASLFSSAVLSGTWEFGVWPATAEEPMPPAALAVGLRSRSVGERAAAEFLGALRQRWSIDAVAHQWSFGAGGCLPTVHILPHLLPCYAFVGESIVVAWNEAALARSQIGKGAVDARNILVAHPAAFPPSDALLTQLRHPGTSIDASPMPWAHVEFVGGNAEGSTFYDVRLFDGA